MGKHYNIYIRNADIEAFEAVKNTRPGALADFIHNSLNTLPTADILPGATLDNTLEDVLEAQE